MERKTEIWKNINGYNDYYQVSNLGKIKSLRRTVNCPLNGSRKIKESLLYLKAGKNGYILVTLSKESIKSNILVHRLVATNFISNPENKPYVNHKNGIKTDNRVENLEWSTPKENCQHAYNTGLHKKFYGKANKLSKAVRQLSKSGKLLSVFNSTKEAERITGIKSSTIIAVSNKKVNRKTAGGFKWEYK